jgi:broad specificity phosphatase PhoE
MLANFVFVRHGLSCHNATRYLSSKNIKPIKIDKNKLKEKDPELTEIGVDASIENGCIINNIIKNLDKVHQSGIKIKQIDIIGCSPLIRAMETAYYMSRKFDNPPNKIWVFPFLREIDEMSSDKYSVNSIQIIDKNPSYAMKDIEEQKAYLKSKGLLQFFDFSFVETMDASKGRQEPGDIIKFINWFAEHFTQQQNLGKHSNIFIVTHAGVLKDYAKEDFYNNTGFILQTKLSNNFGRRLEYTRYISLINYLPNHFILSYSNYFPDYFCPSNRCSGLCKIIVPGPSLKRINKKCSE